MAQVIKCSKSKKTGVKRAWCKRTLKQVFLHLNVKKSIRYSQIIIILIGLVPTASFAMSPVILVGDANQVVEKAEKACNLLCKLALVAQRFKDTKEGQTAVMWAGYYSLVVAAKSLNLLATPALSQSAMLIAFICASTYGISTIVGSEAVGKSTFVNVANDWCVRGYMALFGASGLPAEEMIDGGIGRGIKFLQALQKGFKG